jgi:hypothetical protein
MGKVQAEGKIKFNLWLKIFQGKGLGKERIFQLYTEEKLRNSAWREFSLLFSVPQCHCLANLYRKQKDTLRAQALQGEQECRTLVLTYAHSKQHGAVVCSRCCPHSSHLALSTCYGGGGEEKREIFQRLKSQTRTRAS